MTKTKAKIRSLSQIDPAVHADKGFEFEIVDTTTGEGIGMFMKVTGQEGTAYQATARKQLNAQLAAKDKANDDKVGEMIEQSIQTCAACVIEWWRYEDMEKRTGRVDAIVIDEAEGDLPLTPENARRVFAIKFVREQAIEKIQNRANFTGG